MEELIAAIQDLLAKGWTFTSGATDRNQPCRLCGKPTRLSEGSGHADGCPVIVAADAFNRLSAGA